MAIKFLDYFKPEFRFALQKLNYEMVTGEADNPEMKIRDSHTLTRTADGETHIYYERAVIFSPQCAFRLEIMFDVVLAPIKSIDSVTDEDIVNAIVGEGMLGEIYGRTSLLVAELTMAGRNSPVILPSANLGRSK